MAKGVLRIRIVGDDSHLRKTFGTADKSFGRFGVIASKAFIGIGAAAVGAGFAMSKAVTSAMELNETVSKTKVVFGDAAGEVLGFGEDMAKSFGLPKQAILDAASNIGLVGKAAGLAAPDAAKMSVKMAKLAADASSFFNVPLPEALEKIRSGLVGETEPLRSFGVLLSAAAVQEEALRLGLVKNTKELTEQHKVMARASIITRQMADASGDLERTQDSAANQFRKVRGQVENLAADVGMKLLPAFSSALTWASSNFPKFAEFADKMVAGAAVAFDGLRGWWESNGPLIAAVARTAFGVASDALGFLTRNMQTFIPIAAGVVGGILAFKAITAVKGWIEATVTAFNLGRGAVEAFKLQLHLAHMQGMTTGQALRSVLGGHLLGLAGIITGTVIAAFVAWKTAQANAKAALEGLTAAIQADSGALAANSRAYVFNTLQKNGMLDIARKLGISLNDVVDAALGEEAAQKRVAAGIKLVNDRRHEAARAIHGTTKSMRDEAHEIKKLEGALGDMAANTKVATRRAAEYIVTVGDAKPAVDKAIVALGKLSQEAQNQASRWMAAGGPVGQAFAQGVAAGLVNQQSLSYINSAASKLAGYTVEAARRFGEIRSPSRLMAREVGQPLAEGIALGIENGQITVNHAMSETLTKLFKSSGAVRAVVNEARALGVQIPDDMAEGIAKGKIPVGKAMNAVMEAAKQIASAKAKEIAEEIAAQVGAIQSAFGGAAGRFGAARSVRAAERDFADAQARKRALPGELADAESALAAARKEAAKVTAEEELAILRAQGSVTQAEDKLKEAREDSETSAEDVRAAELELQLAREALTRTQREARGETDAVTRAQERLNDLRAEERAIDARLIEAKDALTEAQLRAIEAQRAFEESTAALVAQGEKGRAEFVRLGEAIGLSAEAIGRLLRILDQVPGSASKPPGGGNLGPPSGGWTEAEQRRINTLRTRLFSSTIIPENTRKIRKELREMGVPGYARGGVAHGLALVGEEGPELVNVGSPSRVHSAPETARMMGGKTEITLVFPNYVGDKRDLTQAVADVLVPALKQVEKQIGPIPIRVRG